eukprot:TRINITY_DN10483_c0_g1_i17.p1 TRINITY_DN10483_c0_g1~~TRINITY_DN10483_c0_g1_i17.p1  ORF type:complete len:166 (+),score=11.75 TRINITY_DN10483_c0_g1_i17:37-498(+)
MIRRPPRSTRKESSAASDVYKRQVVYLLIEIVDTNLAFAILAVDRKEDFYISANRLFVIPALALCRGLCVFLRHRLSSGLNSRSKHSVLLYHAVVRACRSVLVRVRLVLLTVVAHRREAEGTRQHQGLASGLPYACWEKLPYFLSIQSSVFSS